MAKRKNPSKEKRLRSSAPYSSKIIKAGALIGDTKMLLSHWDAIAPVAENIDRIQRDNVFGKASRSRVEDILVIFRQRYLCEESVTNALVTLARGKFAATALERILYFHSARADQLLHDAVTEILVPMQQQGLVDINVQEFQRSLAELLEGKLPRAWSDITLLRAVQSILATLRDFGVLQGAVNKKIAALFLPIEAFAYIVFYLKQHQPSGAKLLELPDWKLFFLTREGVERFLFESHQRELLEYHVAGSVTRLTFPANTLEEYANVLAQR
ncbi:BrxA family protein [Planctomicrobium sp. SH527]|uniref:BrxA family protein n=1 Tax=Planctomicrobium sp. SH527 TaxID=3448123 RepID=UPI003F5BADF7